MSEKAKVKDYRKLYRKYKKKFIAAQADTASLAVQNGELEFKLGKTEAQLSTSEAQLMAAKTRLGRLEHDAAMNVRKAMDLNYMEVDGNKPILWINTSDPRIANAAAFANIRDRLMRIAPGIEMIILTYGDLKIWELEAKDLEKLGLVRIDGHRGGTLGKDVPRLEGS